MVGKTRQLHGACLAAFLQAREPAGQVGATLSFRRGSVAWAVELQKHRPDLRPDIRLAALVARGSTTLSNTSRLVVSSRSVEEGEPK